MNEYKQMFIKSVLRYSGDKQRQLHKGDVPLFTMTTVSECCLAIYSPADPMLPERNPDHLSGFYFLQDPLDWRPSTSTLYVTVGISIEKGFLYGISEPQRGDISGLQQISRGTS